MRFDALHRLATVGTVLTGLLALVLSGEFGLPVSVPAAVASATGPFLWRFLDRPWAGPLAGGLALAGGVVAGAWALSTTDYLYGAIVYALFLSTLKTFLLRRAGDFLQMYALSFLQVMAAAVVNPGLSFGVMMLPYVILLTLALLLTNLRSGIEAQATAPGGTGDMVAEAVRLRAALSRRDLVRPGFVSVTVAVTVAVFAVSLVFFFLFPRLGLGFFAQQSRRGMAVSGFSEEVRLGDFGTIAEDPEVVMRVRMKSGGTAGPLRMRGQSLDRYDGNAWRKTTVRRRQLQNDPDGRLTLDLRRQRLDVPDVQVQEVYLEPMLGTPRVLFALPTPAAFERPSSVLEALRPDQWRFYADEAGDVSLTGPPQVAIVYTAFSDPRPRDGPRLREATGDDPPAVRETYLALPDLEAGVRELSATLVQGAATRYDHATRVEAWLRDNYTYSLSSSHGEDDPLADFLLRNREGHCEYFASAMVVLLRQAGVPARIVNGFYGGVPNEYGGYVALRRADAHSWVEVHFPGEGWATFDPTAPSALDMRSGRPWWNKLSDAMDAAKLAWYRWVVEYNLEKQIGVLASIFRLKRERDDGFGAGLDRRDLKWIRDRLREWPWGRIGGIALAGLGGLVLAGLWLRRRGRGPGPRALLPADDPALRAWRRLARALAKAGYRRDRAETHLELSARVAAEVPAATSAVEAVVRAYLDRAFGHSVEPPPPDLEARVDEAAAALREAPPPAGRARTPRGPRARGPS